MMVNKLKKMEAIVQALGITIKKEWILRIKNNNKYWTFFHSENRFGFSRTFGGGEYLVIFAGTPPKRVSRLAKYGPK